MTWHVIIVIFQMDICDIISHIPAKADSHTPPCYGAITSTHGAGTLQMIFIKRRSITGALSLRTWQSVDDNRRKPNL